MSNNMKPIIEQVIIEQNQNHETRQNIFIELEKELNRTLYHFLPVSVILL